MENQSRPPLHRRLSVRIRTLLMRRSVRGFSHVLTGNILLTLSQAVQFLILARTLGPIEFGKFAAVASVTAVLTPFAGMGAANVMIMRAARNPTLLQMYFGNALLNAIFTGAALTIISVFGVTPFLGSMASIPIMLVLCVSELIFSKIIDICWQVFISNERLHWTSIFLVAQSVSRLLAVSAFWLLDGHLASAWVWWALGSNILVAGLVFLVTATRIGRPAFDWRLALREFPEGVPFAVGLSAKSFYTDADKVFLARYGAVESVGMYTVAFRLTQMALVPIRAVSFAAQAKYFRAGDSGIDGTIAVAMRLAPPVVGMSVLLGAGFYVAAPLVTLIAGSEYGESVQILRWFAGLPLLLAVQSLLGDILSGSGNQRAAAPIQVLSAVIAGALCVILIPRIDWKGAVAASYLSQLFLVGCLYFAVSKLRRRARSYR
jgi:O-antigen/teichoic acid export membrane protein